MKVQRILQTVVAEEEGRKRWIILAFTSRREFVTWCYHEDTKYDGGHYFTDFVDAYNDFFKRLQNYRFGKKTEFVIEYCARQIGQAKIVWEHLDEDIPAKKKWDGDTSAGSPYCRLRAEGLSHDDAVARIES